MSIPNHMISPSSAMLATKLSAQALPAESVSPQAMFSKALGSQAAFSQSGSSQFPGAEIFNDLSGLQGLKQVDRDAALKQVARQFESMFVSMMLKSMRSANAVFEEDSLFNSNESQFYRDMHDQQLALHLTGRDRGTGLSDILFRQLQRQYGEGDSKSIDTENNDTENNAINQSAKPYQNRTNFLHDQNVKPLNKTGDFFVQEVKQTDIPIIHNIKSLSQSDFVNKLIPHAKQVASKLGIEPEWLIAQSALETGWGKKVLTDNNGKVSNNLFNIKADARWQGDSVSVKTKEYEHNQPYTTKAAFRTYPSISDSFTDYFNFVSKSDRYQKARELSENGQAYMRALQDAGYATDPRYADKVHAVYQRVKGLLSTSAVNSVATRTSESG